jgi:hypothetical protein
VFWVIDIRFALLNKMLFPFFQKESFFAVRNGMFHLYTERNTVKGSSFFVCKTVSTSIHGKKISANL